MYLHLLKPSISHLVFVFYFFNPHPRTCILISEREEGKDRGRETAMRERNVDPLPLERAPSRDWIQGLGVCPDSESSLWVHRRCFNQQNHTGQGRVLYFWAHKSSIYFVIFGLGMSFSTANTLLLLFIFLPCRNTIICCMLTVYPAIC